MVEVQKMMEIEFLKEKTYTEINDMFRELSSKLDVAKKELEKISDLALDGLIYGGEHHKMYYLEEILKHSVDEEKFTGFKKEYEWEEGVPA